jgi:hypothetical protein
MKHLRIFIGYDEREHDAARVAAKSLRDMTDNEIVPEFLCIDKLVAQGLFWRSMDRRGSQHYDLVSNAPTSTDFAVARFLTPILCQTGFALFVDCDVVFLEDPRDMLHDIVAGEGYPVYVVKHEHEPVELWKMVNQKQTSYPRKNWSSVMLFNCQHPANERLSLRDVNERPGRDLHAFYWLHDSEIGELDKRWNWLVNVQPPPWEGIDTGIAHFTLGGPFNEGWAGAPHDEIWLRAHDA